MTIDRILKLASDIRELDGAHDMGAAELAEALVNRGWTIPTPWYIDPATTQPTRIAPSVDAIPLDADDLIEGLTIALRPVEEKQVFENGDSVEVNTDWGWIRGHITEIYPYGLTSVHTEHGPVSVLIGAKRIRKITNG